MTNEANKSDRAYPAFAASMLASLAAHEAFIARHNAGVTKYQGAADTSAATVRPSK